MRKACRNQKFEPEERTHEFPEPIESQINRKTDEKVHGGRNVPASPISITFTLALCLKNTASVTGLYLYLQE